MKIFLPYENIPLNGNIFYRMKTLYQMKIYFIEWKYIFYRMKIYFYRIRIFLSNENNFYRMQIYFYRMKIIFYGILLHFCVKITPFIAEGYDWPLYHINSDDS